MRGMYYDIRPTSRPVIWNVFMYNFNKKTIDIINVFDHHSFYNDCVKIAKKCKKKNDFADEVQRSLMYFCWSKCEYETVVGSLFKEPPVQIKVDVYQQVAVNWDRFIEYLWKNKGKLTDG